MEHQVLKHFVDKESNAYLAKDSFFVSKNYERVMELAKMGFIKPNENSPSLKKATRKKVADKDAGEN